MDFSSIKQIMDRVCENKIPGCCIVAYKDDKKVLEYCTGYASLETKEKMTMDKLFNIYSSSKVATCAAALQLYEKGYFLLDTPVYEFIPEFGNIKVKENGTEREPSTPITMRHLFTMTSGLTYNVETDNVRAVKQQTDGKMFTLDVIRAYVKDGITFDPGAKWQYSLSHDVLGGVIEVISGMKFRDYMKKYIFEPLEMGTATMHNEDIRDKMAEQYMWVGDYPGLSPERRSAAEKWGFLRDGGYNQNISKRILDTLYLGTEYDCGGAGITVSTGDYAKFTAALARGGLGINGERILSSGTVNLMRTNQLSGRVIQGYDQNGGYGYGLGVKTTINTAGAGACGTLGEFGWSGAGGTFMVISPEEKISLFFTEHMIDGQGKFFEQQIKTAIYRAMED